MKKKMLSLFLALALLSGLMTFTGCKKDEGAIEGDGKPLGKFDPPIEITYCKHTDAMYINIIEGLGYTETDNMWTKAYEEDLGIKLKMKFGGTDILAYMQQLTSVILMDDVPDFVSLLDGNFAYNTIKTMVDSDLAADIGSLYEVYASDRLKEIVNLAGMDIFKPCTFDGKLRGFPQITGAENNAYAYYWIRKDWLDNLNLDMPENLDELIEVMKSFTDSDPDGNGIKDTYGMGLADDFLTVNGMFFNGYGSYPKTWQKGSDGKLFYGTLATETKTALSKLKDLVSGGYATNPTGNGYGLMINDAIAGKVGIIPGMVHLGLSLNEAYKKNNDANFVAIPALNGTDKPLKVTAPFNAGWYYTVSSKCKHPEVIFKMVNLFIDKLESGSAEINAKYFDNEKGQSIWPVALMSAGYPGQTLDGAKMIVESIKSNTPPEIESKRITYDNVMKWVNEKNPDFWGWNALFGLEGSELLSEYFFENDIFQTSKFNAAPTNSMMLYKEDLDAFEIATMISIVTGEKPVEYFDTFVTEWLKSGGQEITDEVNEWNASYKDFLHK